MTENAFLPGMFHLQLMLAGNRTADYFPDKISVGIFFNKPAEINYNFSNRLPKGISAIITRKFADD